MPSPLENQVRAALDGVKDPLTGKGLVASGRVSGLVARADGKVGFVIETGVGAADEPLRKVAEEVVARVAGVSAVTAVLTAEATTGARSVPAARPAPHAHTPAPQPPAREEIARPARGIIAVASAKGGVGKSTVAVNLAVALAQSGKRVGVMDCDIYGPNVPRMFGRYERPPVIAGRIQPLESFGVKLMSIGFLRSEERRVGKECA